MLLHKLVCGLASDLEGSDNVVFCKGYGDVQQSVVGNGHCCSYFASGGIVVLEERVCTGMGDMAGQMRFLCVVDQIDC